MNPTPGQNFLPEYLPHHVVGASLKTSHKRKIHATFRSQKKVQAPQKLRRAILRNKRPSKLASQGSCSRSTPYNLSILKPWTSPVLGSANPPSPLPFLCCARRCHRGAVSAPSCAKRAEVRIVANNCRAIKRRIKSEKTPR